MPRGAAGVGRGAGGHVMNPSPVLAATPPASAAATSTSVLSPSYVLDHEYGQTPQNQIMRGSGRFLPPARTDVSVRCNLNLKFTHYSSCRLWF